MVTPKGKIIVVIDKMGPNKLNSIENVYILKIGARVPEIKGLS